MITIIKNWWHRLLYKGLFTPGHTNQPTKPYAKLVFVLGAMRAYNSNPNSLDPKTIATLTTWFGFKSKGYHHDKRRLLKMGICRMLECVQRGRHPDDTTYLSFAFRWYLLGTKQVTNFPVQHPSLSAFEAFHTTENKWQGLYGYNRIMLLQAFVDHLRTREDLFTIL